MFNDLYEKAWLPLRNHLTPVMKQVGKQKVGAKFRKKYDKLPTPCDRLPACAKVREEIIARLRAERAALDPMSLVENFKQGWKGSSRW